MHKQTFITLEYPGSSIASTLLMIASLREFGGTLAESPVWVLFPKSKGDFSAEERGKFQEMNARLIACDLEEHVLKFPFGAKVGVAAVAEKLALGQTEFLTWLDSDTLILTEPEEFNLPPEKAFGYRPVHHRLIGLPWGAALDPFWALIYQHCQVTAQKTFPVQTHTGEQIQPYFNAGTFVIRPEQGILRQWWQAFQDCYRAPDFLPFYEKDSRYAIFMHQAVFTGVVLNKLEPGALQALSSRINYPLHLHQEIRSDLRANSIDDLITIRYEDIFAEPGWQNKIPISESLVRWIKAHRA